MFDIGFTELLLISAVALLVAGPQNLPGLIRDVARSYGQVRSWFSEIKTDIKNEIGADEIREQLRVESIQADFQKDKENLKSLDDSLQSTNIDLLKSLSNDSPTA